MQNPGPPGGLTAPLDPQVEGSDDSRPRKRGYAASKKQLRSCVQGPRFYPWHKPQNHLIRHCILPAVFAS